MDGNFRSPTRPAEPQEENTRVSKNLCGDQKHKHVDRDYCNDEEYDYGNEHADCRVNGWQCRRIDAHLIKRHKSNIDDV
jgi:hypothetical protein